MKLFVLVCLVGAVAAGKLPSNQYIPPSSNSYSAGGSGNFLQTPHASPSNQYIPPTHTQQYSGQSNQYSQQQPQQQQYGGQQQQQYGGQQQHKEQIPILSYNNIPNSGDGSYSFDFSTGNGIMQQEQGHNNQAGGSEHSEQVVAGSYSYTGDDGHVYTVNYKADANGFQATGDHLPTPPPIPEAIAKSIAFNAQAQSHGSGSGNYNQGNQGGYSQQQHQQQQQQQQQQGSYSQQQSHGSPQNQYIPPNRQSFNQNSGYQY